MVRLLCCLFASVVLQDSDAIVCRAMGELLPEEYSTGHSQTDEWLMTVGADPTLFETMAKLPKNSRFLIVSKCMVKDNVKFPVPYLQKVFDLEVRTQSIQGQNERGARSAPYPGSRVPGAVGQQIQPASRTAPQHQARPLAATGQRADQYIQIAGGGQSKPDWVSAAWTMQSRKATFVQYVVDLLPADTQVHVKNLTPDLQRFICMALVLAPAAWRDPVGFVKQILETIGTLSSQETRPESLAPVGGRNVVVLHVGDGIGCEPFAVTGMPDMLTKLGLNKRPVKVMEMFSFGQAQSSVAIHSDIHKKGRSFRYERRLGVGVMNDVGRARLKVWRAMSVHIIVLFTCPAEMEPLVDGTVPDIAHFMETAVSFIQTVSMSITCGMTMNVVVFDIDANGSQKSKYLDCVYKEGFVHCPSQFGLPLRPWRVRSVAPIPPPNMTQPLQLDEVFLSRCSERLNVGGRQDASWLPSPQELEELCDAVVYEPDESARQALQEQTAMVRMPGGKNFLMDRGLLMFVHGKHGWGIKELFDEVYPCQKYISRATGQARMEHEAGSEPCGVTRYCETCFRLYKALSEQPNGPLLVHCLIQSFCWAMDSISSSLPDSTSASGANSAVPA